MVVDITVKVVLIIMAVFFATGIGIAVGKYISDEIHQKNKSKIDSLENELQREKDTNQRISS
ncbi:hypothetical protein LCGC14_2147960 [marine sediment metagenome]|uniref:Uncharacterized protein n=1 Tax=marine sediment metagenome TaxID=412755 RepID=A0A0F9G9A9_9ZZZZ